MVLNIWVVTLMRVIWGFRGHEEVGNTKRICNFLHLPFRFCLRPLIYVSPFVVAVAKINFYVRFCTKLSINILLSLS